MKRGKYTIATLGSHSALQILKGAKDEGFKTLLITPPARASFYARFPFIDKIITIPSFAEFPKLEQELKKKNCIIIPHGSFVAYLGMEGNKNMHIPYFGNKKVLDWEANRRLQLQWFNEAKILTPKIFSPKETIDRLVIVKTFGADGGSGYFLAKNKKEINLKLHTLKKGDYVIQEYVVGVPMYFHYFYSSLTKTLELLSIDRRYETNADAIGRIPYTLQSGIKINPSFVVVGNSPLVLRESLLPMVYDMGEQIVTASKKLIDSRGLFGAFCLETIVTPDQKIYTIEISCRIVAGTNLFIDSSPYAALLYDEPMSTGRRIAREIKSAIKKRQLEKLLD